MLHISSWGIQHLGIPIIASSTPSLTLSHTRAHSHTLTRAYSRILSLESSLTHTRTHTLHLFCLKNILGSKCWVSQRLVAHLQTCLSLFLSLHLSFSILQSSFHYLSLYLGFSSLPISHHQKLLSNWKQPVSSLPLPHAHFTHTHTLVVSTSRFIAFSRNVTDPLLSLSLSLSLSRTHALTHAHSLSQFSQ